MLYLQPLLAPVLCALAALVAAAGPEMRPRRVLTFVNAAVFLAFLVGIANTAVLVAYGPGSFIIGEGVAAVGTRVDLVSTVMILLVSFVGWIVTRFSATYLDGEARQGPFAAWMSATLASVLLLVMSGTLLLFVVAFIATSLCLHNLLLFYPERPAARRAARKKFILSRVADVALTSAALLLAIGYGTGDIAKILDSAREGVAPSGVGLAAGLLAFSAILKSAQFPFHGWLTEVMETPTPVSALLHAGVINAGGFLLIRFADVMLLSPLTLAALVMVGAFTALFGSLVMLTQSAIKTSLAWSTVAQMGFMILQCGLALFPIALLHIVAHSLYKAHAFLSSGNAVEATQLVRRPGPVAVPSLRAVARSFLLALIIFTVAGLAFGFWHKPPQAIALSAILIFGVAYLVAQGLADAAPWSLTRRVGAYAGAAALAYFGLQWLAYAMTEGQLPAAPQQGPLEWALIVLAVITFGLTAVAQALFPLWAHHPAAAGLRVHMQNGLYVNALFDRLLGHFRVSSHAFSKD